MLTRVTLFLSLSLLKLFLLKIKITDKIHFHLLSLILPIFILFYYIILLFISLRYCFTGGKKEIFLSSLVFVTDPCPNLDALT